MTENEAIREFQRNIDLPFGSNISKEATKLAIQALEEIQKYREIGTVDECREARDKQQVPKKPTYDGDGYAPDGTFVWDEWLCPCCWERYEVDDDYDYCPNCGQKLDWSDEDEID